MADVRQMYRQILIAPNHRDYQRIFWRASPHEPLKEYRLNTVTYGVASSPFLACRSLQRLAEDEGESYPIAKRILLSDVYVDDVVTGCASLEDAQQAKSQIIALFNRGCFQLRKWVSNKSELLSDLPAEVCLTGTVSLDESDSKTLKVLGLKWDPTSDSFLFEIKAIDRICTKRSILSELARIFDPLGFLSPVTIHAKSLIQKLWILGIGWDQTPPDEVIRAWNTYQTQLLQLSQLRIPRKITCENVRSYELHGFADSSETAYGAVIFLRVTDAKGQVRVFLVCSKARVVPLKRISLPRLELCAAVLLSDLYLFVRDSYLSRISFDATYFWSDSTVVLSWLRSPATRWATFVANRVSHIQSITTIECWHHILSGDNPADICSRGQFPNEILHNSLWWTGPQWLSQDRDSWPSSLGTTSPDEGVIVNMEARKLVALVTELHNSERIDEPTVFDDLISRHSTLPKLINVLSYINRFINNSHSPLHANRNKFLNNVERHTALMQIVKYVQNHEFKTEILNIKSNKPLLKPFRKLNPFLDEQGVLRVGGRISRSGLEYEKKHPAFLPTNHQLTFLIIEFIHRNYCHPGINTTHFLLLQQFWIISAKRAIRNCLSKCVHCYRTNPKPVQPPMSDLPSFRVNQVKAFSIVGVDFGGPFRIKLGPHRGAKIDKAYLCLFICLATKAVHLEVVSTLSTNGFIATLRRFVARRGRCNVIHADCGTNFIGARNQLSSLMEQASNAEKIEFKFNPPSAPHFGGVWEIQIKAAKSHLYRVIGDQVLTFEELTTLFTQIEAVLNSRPLCSISSDPNDLSALTPGHFLTLEPLTAVPDQDLTNVNINRLNRWQLLQSFHQNFWSRWKHEYLNSLTQRAKWTKDSKPLNIGSMVIIKDENRSPLHWPLGRVTNLISGADGVARIAILKTATSQQIQRPLVKLCPLPIEQ
ncbi:jg22410 [Pararge aegeria aegeria]|uniref:Jg22410 protein n=1 Tax=Pararge aegeria aegeria TaxID=348720 RepID=A0A8S4R197_9NEOP|nr:jg22410 [Pararge aegeria aegeria]